MGHKIFLSHNYNDKPLVEAVAIKLAGIFGQDQVFYDAWSIKPGDGIIDRMNSGLEAPEFVFFFVSKNSLTSGMVKLEWQNALYSASSGKTRIIPVRIDGSDMPAVLKQTLYIDMHTIGQEAAISQIVSVTQGNVSFTPQHLGFSNLAYQLKLGADGHIDITIKASHLMEPNPHFLMVLLNAEKQVKLDLGNGQPFIGGYNEGVVSSTDGTKYNAFNIRPVSGSLTPDHPMRIKIIKTDTEDLVFFGVFHEKSEGNWVPLSTSI